MTGTDLVAVKAKMAQQAETYAAQEQVSGGTFLSTRGGILTFGEEELPGNQACVIILDAVRENTYYSAKFDPDTPAAPVCYAFGRDGDEMEPHESMSKAPDYFVPQSASCDVCPMNEWGSADQGRGKACQNRRRLALIPAGVYTPKRGSRDFDLDLFTDAKHFQSAEIVFLKLPVMSVKDWSKFVTNIAGSHNLPPYGVVARVSLEQDPKSQYRVKFEMLEVVSDDLLPIVMVRHEEAVKGVISGYSVPEEQEPATRGSLKGLRRR